MADKQRTGNQTAWILGCGLGCAAVVLVILGLGFLGARFARQTTQGFETAIETRKDLEQRFGPPESYVPAADGTVTQARLEIFLAVREASAPARERLTEAWSNIPLSPEAAQELESQDFAEQMRSVFKITRSSVGLAAEMGELYEARNQAMADAGIGLGEYTYIYALAFYSWLGHSPSDGPDSALSDGGSVGSRMGDAFFGRVRSNLVQMLRNQLASLPVPAEGGKGKDAEADDGWREALGNEIAALAADRRRLPWQDGLPPAIAASFEPYRDRLETSYNPATNAFELGRSRKRGRFSITAD